MLKIVNTLSIINMIAAASKLDADVHAAYMSYTSTYSKNHQTKSEFDRCISHFHISHTYIQKCNERAEASGDPDAVYCGHNRFSDWSDEEFEQFVSGLQADQIGETAEAVPGSGRRLEDLPNNVSHKQWMNPVKDQGYCGSCAAFAATTALEGTLAKKEENQSPPHLSEQQLLDCTMDTKKTRELFGDISKYQNYGCEGGWISHHWQFMKDHGAMRIENYEYNAKEGECKHDVKNIYGKVASYKSYVGKNNVPEMMEVVAQQPVGATIHASTKKFKHYRKGIMTSCCDKEDDPDCDDTSLPINHAITVVGYDVNENGKGSWTVQNSWGSGWGDGGFIQLDLFGGDAKGVCNINNYGVFSVEINSQSIGEQY